MTRQPKTRLIETAERLFAQRGIAAVSLREIGAAAGQRNTAAVLYHFGSKEGLLEAILEHRRQAHASHRQALLAARHRSGALRDLRTVVEGMVYPYAESLVPGSYAMRFLAQRLTSAVDGHVFLPVEEDVSHRLADGLRAALPRLPAAILQRRARSAWRLVIETLAHHERDLESGRRPVTPTALVAADVVEMVIAMMRAPLPRTRGGRQRKPAG